MSTFNSLFEIQEYLRQHLTENARLLSILFLRFENRGREKDLVACIYLSILFLRFRAVFPASKPLFGDSNSRGQVHALSGHSPIRMYLLLINLSKPRSSENLAQNPGKLLTQSNPKPSRPSPHDEILLKRSIIEMNRSLDPIQEASYNLVMNNRISSKTPTMRYPSFTRMTKNKL